MTLRVLIADDQALVRSGFRLIVETRPDLEVVGEAEDGEEAVRLAAELGPDVVLMDVRMPGVDGIEATRRIVASGSDARILVLTTFDLDEYVYAAMRAGASGFLLKDVRPADLVDAIRLVADGNALLGPTVTRRLLERFADADPGGGAGLAVAGLTEREREILGSARQRALERRDRRAARRRRDDRQDARLQHPPQARRPRPRPGRDRRLRRRARAAAGARAALIVDRRILGSAQDGQAGRRRLARLARQSSSAMSAAARAAPSGSTGR